jgi:GT2 family glycosyltransferase
MRVLVVTPTLGESRWLVETVASVAALRLLGVHLLVTPAPMVAELARRFPLCQVVPEPSPNRGMYAAINAGVAAGKDWDAFTWLNDDDILAAGFAHLCAEFERRPEIGVMYGRVALIDSAGTRVARHPVAPRGEDLAPLLARGIIPFAQPGTVIRREWFERVGGLDETYRLTGDFDFFGRALLAGAPFAFADTTVASFRLRAGQLSKQRGEMEAEKTRALKPFASVRRGRLAWWRFRCSNLALYLERLPRHGWRSMREIYDRVE